MPTNYMLVPTAPFPVCTVHDAPKRILRYVIFVLRRTNYVQGHNTQRINEKFDFRTSDCRITTDQKIDADHPTNLTDGRTSCRYLSPRLRLPVF